MCFTHEGWNIAVLISKKRKERFSGKVCGLTCEVGDAYRHHCKNESRLIRPLFPHNN